ncbi:DUF6230 family protein [Embleya sp. AB8]|uniref:DUF6230 family protein n=1 Tax=Embleya sp. AB8 TaxID=3156304 RepID=UPI003C72A3D5
MDKKVQAGSGKTRWKRFGIAAVPVAAMTVGMFAGVANGAIPIDIAVSGGGFKVSAQELDASDFSQYGNAVKSPNGLKPVAVAAIGDARITKLCQSVEVPLFGVVLRIDAGGDGAPATAKNMTLAMDALDGDAEFTNIDIGVDASTMGKDAKNPFAKGPADIGNGEKGGFGQQATHATFTNVKQSAQLVTASNFRLNGLHLKIAGKDKACF